MSDVYMAAAAREQHVLTNLERLAGAGGWSAELARTKVRQYMRMISESARDDYPVVMPRRAVWSEEDAWPAL